MQSMQEEPLVMDTTYYVGIEEEGENAFRAMGIAKNGFEFHVHSTDYLYQESIHIPHMSIEEAFIFSDFFAVREVAMSDMKERLSDYLSRNYVEKLLLRDHDELNIEYAKKGQKLVISINLYLESSYYLEFWPDLYGKEFEDISQYVKLTYISKAQFESIPKRETEEASYKKEAITYTDSSFSITFENGKIETFTDYDCGCEGNQDYTYGGYVEKLDAFMVSMMGWEDYHLFLFDASNGALIFDSQGGYFDISPQLTHIIDLAFDIYEGGTYFTLAYINENRKAGEAIYLYFTQWRIVGDTKWLNSSTFVLPILFTPYRSEKDDIGVERYYIKVEILAQ